MSITTRDELIHALANNSSSVMIDKSSISNSATGNLFSLWRAGGTPGQGAIPTTAEICTKELVGSIQFANQTAPAKSYYAWQTVSTSNSATSIEIHDRLAHMGGLSGTVITAQGSLNLTGLSADRLGESNYSDVQWWLEWYVNTGATAVTATVNVTYDDDSTGDLEGVSLASNSRASRMYGLPPAVAGRYIKAVNSVTLSATTGTAGDFGITATRPRTMVASNTGNKLETYDWASLGLPEIANDSCLFMIMLCPTSFTGAVRGQGKIAHG